MRTASPKAHPNLCPPRTPSRRTPPMHTGDVALSSIQSKYTSRASRRSLSLPTLPIVTPQRSGCSTECATWLSFCSDRSACMGRLTRCAARARDQNEGERMCVAFLRDGLCPQDRERDTALYFFDMQGPGLTAQSET